MEHTATRVSIIIPTLNEAGYLPALLHSIGRQTVRPQEVIVADGHSRDATRAVARRFHCTVVDGGSPSAGRNRGAAIARGPLLLFLDADVVIPPDFLASCMEEMHRRELSIATCSFDPYPRTKLNVISCAIANTYFRHLSRLAARAPGFCIFVEKHVFEAAQGFDEFLVLAEDHDFVQRAQKHGRFGRLRPRIQVSMRRMMENGELRCALQYIAIELHLLLVGKIRSRIFNYKFGHHGLGVRRGERSEE